jgi:hypothetical protein
LSIRTKCLLKVLVPGPRAALASRSDDGAPQYVFVPARYELSDQFPLTSVRERSADRRLGRIGIPSRASDEGPQGVTAPSRPMTPDARLSRSTFVEHKPMKILDNLDALAGYPKTSPNMPLAFARQDFCGATIQTCAGF